MTKNFKLKIENSRRGFTLIEILIVIAIVGILASITVVNSGKNADRDVRQEADRFVTFLRSVQNKSVSGDKISGSLAGKLCGYGIKEISNTQFQIYYVQSTGLDDGCSTHLNDNGTNLTETFDFRNGVSINSGFSTADKLFFIVPSGEVYLNGDRSSGFPVSISLLKDGATVNVNVELAGKIY